MDCLPFSHSTFSTRVEVQAMLNLLQLGQIVEAFARSSLVEINVNFPLYRGGVYFKIQIYRGIFS